MEKFEVNEVMNDITLVAEVVATLHYDYSEEQLKELEMAFEQFCNATDDFHAEKVVRNSAKAFCKKWNVG